MPRPRRRTVVFALAVLLLAADSAWGAGGGGSSGFGGGGGGGGGGFSGGGGSSGGDGDFGFAEVVVIAVVLAIFFGFGALKAARVRKRRAARQAAVVGQAAVAADEDAAFDADAVTARGRELFEAVQVAWTRGDRAALGALAGPSLMEEWARRLDDFNAKGWTNVVKLLEAPAVAYVGLVNRAEDADDRVVVHVACDAEDYVRAENGRLIYKDGKKGKRAPIAEYWTLAKHDGAWRVESIESESEGAHNLTGDVVATPWEDDGRLHDAAVAERAAAEALPEGVSPAEVADLDFQGPARTAAQDLALADGRFDPALIEASVRRAVDAWVAAVDGADDALEAAARPAAVTVLLHPGGEDRRLVVRGPRVERITIAGLDAAATPPELAVEVVALGRRYVEDRATAAVLSGDRESAARFTERWTLVLDGEGEWPWRIGAVGAPAAA